MAMFSTPGMTWFSWSKLPTGVDRHIFYNNVTLRWSVTLLGNLMDRPDKTSFSLEEVLATDDSVLIILV